eukprot:SAG31_NODE_651_length_13184_cov_4.999541_11_plen_151_part_00
MLVWSMLRLTALRRAAYQPSHVLSRTGPAFRQMATSTKPRKPGVATDDELASFVSTHQTNVVVVDARNSNFTVEPGDEKTAAIAPLGGPTRPRTVNLPYDRANKSMDLAPLEPVGPPWDELPAHFFFFLLSLTEFLIFASSCWLMVKTRR